MTNFERFDLDETIIDGDIKDQVSQFDPISLNQNNNPQIKSSTARLFDFKNSEGNNSKEVKNPYKSM